MAQDISAILGGSQAGATTTIADSRSTLNKDQFLKLLLVQLKNQDPLQPSADPNEFTKQMTQFGQLEQLFNVNDSLKSIGADQTRMARSDAVSMIGKQVEAKSELIEVRGGVNSPIGISLQQPASSVKVEVMDTLGRVVRTIDYTDQEAGSTYHDFDGKDNTGSDLSGVYSVRISAKSANGTNIPAQGILKSVVSGVDYTTGSPVLRIGNRNVAIEDVLSISQA